MDGEIVTNQPEIEKDKLSTPSLMQSENLVMFMLSPLPTVVKIENALKGKTLQADGTYVADAKSKCNKLGITEIKILLSTILDTSIFLSIFNEERIIDICKDLEYELNEKFCDNWKKWKMQPDDIPLIIREIMVQVEGALNRALRFGKDTGAFGMQLQAIAQQVQTREIIEKNKKRTFSLFPKSDKNV